MVKGGSKQVLVVIKHQSAPGLEFSASTGPHCTRSLPGNPLTLRVSSKSGRLGPWVGITGGTGGLKGRARTQVHW